MHVYLQEQTWHQGGNFVQSNEQIFPPAGYCIELLAYETIPHTQPDVSDDKLPSITAYQPHISDDKFLSIKLASEVGSLYHQTYIYVHACYKFCPILLTRFENAWLVNSIYALHIYYKLHIGPPNHFLSPTRLSPQLITNENKTTQPDPVRWKVIVPQPALSQSLALKDYRLASN